MSVERGGGQSLGAPALGGGTFPPSMYSYGWSHIVTVFFCARTSVAELPSSTHGIILMK